MKNNYLIYFIMTKNKPEIIVALGFTLFALAIFFGTEKAWEITGGIVTACVAGYFGYINQK